jgi:hypothetical protein
MSARIHYLPNAEPDPDEPNAQTLRHGDGDGGGTEELVVRIVLDMPELPDDPEPEPEPAKDQRGGWRKSLVYRLRLS